VIPAQPSTPATPEFDFAMPATPALNVTDDVVITSHDLVAAPIAPEVPAISTKAVEADDAVFEFDLDDIDEVEPVSALHTDLFATDSTTPVNPISSFDEDHIMTVTDDHDVVVTHDEVTLSPGHDDIFLPPGHDEISVHISGEFEPVPDPLENLPFELEAPVHEPVQTLIVEDAILPAEPELVVDDVEMPVVHHEPAALSLEGLAAVGAGVIGAGLLGHVSDDLELETPVVVEPVLQLEAENVFEPMIGHFDPEPEPVVAHVEPEPVVAHVEPEPVYFTPEPVFVTPEPVVAHIEPEPVQVKPVQLEPTPVAIPAVIEPIHLESSSQTSTAVVHKDFFNTNILRRQFNASALMDIRAQISKALNGREVQLGVFVGRAAQRGLYLLGTTNVVTLNKLEAELVPLSTVGLHHSFIEAVQSVNHADVGQANGLAILDASGLGVDDLVLPAKGALLALGQINNGTGTLTLSGDFPAKAGAEFLAHVAQSLETPVGLVL
jgi:hypothetical protein